MVTTDPASSFIHTIALLDELAAEQDWSRLRDLAKRHKASSVTELALKATRCLALVLSHSTDAEDKEQAISIYQSLTSGANAEANDRRQGFS